MNILFLSTWNPFPPDNGSKIRAYYLLHALSQSHQVSLVTFAPDSNGVHPDIAFEQLSVPADPFRYVKLPPIVKYMSPMPVAYWPSRLMTATVAGMANARQWDAVVAIQAPAGRYARMLSGVPSLIDLDTTLSYQLHEKTAVQAGLSGRLRTVARLVSWQKAHHYEARLLSHFDMGVVASPAERDFAAALADGSGARIEVVPNGVDCTYNRPSLSAVQSDTLVYNGSLTYSANLDAMSYFVRAIFPLIRQEIDSIQLTITGATTGVDLSTLPLVEGVHLSGYVDDIRPLVAGAGVCIVPLREGGGTRLKILEAMALGTPVVSTTKGAEGLDVVHGEHLLIADEPECFAAHTVNLLRSPELRRRLVENARRLVEQKYDWRQIGRRFVSLVEDVVQQRAGEALP